MIRRSCLATLGLVVACLLIGTSSADASLAHPFKETFGGATPPSFDEPQALAVEQSTGDLYVADAGANEVQQIVVAATAGTFRLCFEGQCTGDLAFDVPAIPEAGQGDGPTENVRNALEALSTIGPRHVSVEGGPGGRDGSRPYVIQVPDNIEQISCEDGATPLSGGAGCTATTTRQGVAASLSRWRPDGEPAPFSALGTNVIDAKAGPGGKPCFEEPASCDQTPQGLFQFYKGRPGGQYIQVAVDNSGGITDGDIYVTYLELGSVDVFASDGSYLGQLTAAGMTPLSSPCGVAVDSTGAVYVSQFGASGSAKYVPSANPPLDSDGSLIVSPESGGGCGLAVGVGPSAGYLFAHAQIRPTREAFIAKFNADSGEFKYSFGPLLTNNPLLATDPTNGDVVAAFLPEEAVREFDASGATSAVEVGLPIEAPNEVEGVAVGAAGEVYVSSLETGQIEVFKPLSIVPTVTVGDATAITGTKAKLSATVNLEGVAATECKFEYGTTASYGHVAPCEGSIPTDSSDHEIAAQVEGLTANGITYHFRVVVANANGPTISTDHTFITGATAITEAATGVTDTTADLHGTVRPEGVALLECKFEYGTSRNYGSTAPCDPAAGSIPADVAAHTVAAALTGLTKNAVYHFRVVTRNLQGTFVGADLKFTVLGPPQITEEVGQDVEASTADLHATVDPSGFETSYRIEWGTSTAYGHIIPAEGGLSIGSGMSPIEVDAPLSELQEHTTYHFRVLATNASGTTEGPDYSFMTLNAAGLPDDRGYELVSPADKRPVGDVGFLLGANLRVQASDDGDGLYYLINNGLVNATAGGEVAYVARRQENGWTSTQVTPPALIPSVESGSSSTGHITYASPGHLTCTLVSTPQPLTNDVSPVTLESGGFNLFRRNADGSNTLISNVVPSNPGLNQATQPFAYKMAGVSEGCDHIYFSTKYDLLPGNENGLYEWVDGALHDAGVLPDGTVPSSATPGTPEDELNVLSDDGSKLFFTAESDAGGDVGKEAVFVREDGSRTVDVSQSQNPGTPNDGPSFYETAAADGSRVLFLARYGLATTSSSGATGCSGTSGAVPNGSGCDLYSYDTEHGTLEDVSADSNPLDTGGAAVVGVLGASEDGSYVYFAARGQLIPEAGDAAAQNEAAGQYNVYLSHQGHLAFVGAITSKDVRPEGGGALVSFPDSWSARVTPNGTRLLFESRARVTGYDNEGSTQAYVYDTGTDTTTCISCPDDGRPSLATVGTEPLVHQQLVGNPHEYPRTLSDDGERAFFESPDPLAPGAVSGQENLYEWGGGSVHWLGTGVSFQEASSSGDDVFVYTRRRLVPEDVDTENDAYDLRVGGGFPYTPPPAPCDVSTSECQGAASTQPSGAPVPASSIFSGPGNRPSTSPGCPKKKSGKKQKCQKKKQSGKKHRSHKKHHSKRKTRANRDRRTGR
jgi:hypothetical protein